MSDEKKGLLKTVGGKVQNLLAPNDKDLKKLREKTEKLKKKYEVHDLAVKFLENPNDEVIKKKIMDLDDASAKMFKAIMEKKKKFVFTAAGVLALITIGGVAVASSKKKPIDVNYDELESDDVEDEDEDDDDVEDEDDDDVEEDESVEETDDTPVKE